MTLPADLLARPGLTAGHPIGYGAWRLCVQMYLPAATSAQWDVDGWDAREWGGSSWVDVTGHVRAIEWTRGTSTFGGAPEVGSASVTLDNSAAAFSPLDPSNSFGGFVSVVGGVVVNQHFVPGRLVRIVAHNPADPSAAGFVPQFTGEVESWTETGMYGGRDSSVNVTLTETLAALAGVNEVALAGVVGDNEAAPARITRLASAAGWQYGYVFGAGSWSTYPLQSTDMADNRLGEVYLAGASVGAVVRSARDGRIAAYSLADPPAAGPVAAPVCWLAPNADASPSSCNADPEQVEWLTDREPIVNVVEFARVGGTVQTATNAPSISLHGRRNYGRNDLVNKSDSLTAALAAARIYTNPLRLASLELDGDADNRALGVLLSLDVHNTITVKTAAHNGGIITLTGALVEAITHRVTPVHPAAPLRWTGSVALGAQSPPTFTPPE